jgi:heat shock protein HtpX
MEMCVDNPREEFADLFATHPSIESRVKALVEYAGGHDPGLLALSAPEDSAQTDRPPAGPWGDAPAPPFLPPKPPVTLGDPSTPDRPVEPPSGPWGPHRG